MREDPFEQVPENPFIDLPGCLGREFEETDAALSGTRRPRHLAARFHAQPRTAQFEAHAQLLLRTNRRHHLQPDPLMTDIANNTAVRLLHTSVDQSAKFVSVLRPRFLRGSCSCVHPYTAKSHRQIAGRLESYFLENSFDLIAGWRCRLSNYSGSGVVRRNRSKRNPLRRDVAYEVSCGHIANPSFGGAAGRIAYQGTWPNGHA